MGKVRKMADILDEVFKADKIKYISYLTEIKRQGYRVFVNEKGEHRVIKSEQTFGCADY